MALRLRLCVAVAIVATSFPIFAYRGRPLSDLRFGHHRYTSDYMEVASDGTDFLLLTQTGRSLFTQQVTREGQVRPNRWIASDAPWGSPLHLVWAGDEYLAQWFVGGSTFVFGRISRNGTLIDTYEAPAPEYSWYRPLVSNGHSAFEILYRDNSGLILEPRPISGRSAGASVRIDTGLSYVSVDAIGLRNGYALVASAANGTWLMFLRDDGTVARGPLLVDATPCGYGKIASNGTSIAIVCQHLEVSSIIVSMEGYVQQGRRTILHPDPEEYAITLIDDLVTDGAQYVVMLSLSKWNTSGIDSTGLLRLGTDGTPIGDLVPVEQGRLASNGRDLLLLRSDGFCDCDCECGETHRAYAAMLDGATLAARDPVLLGRTVTAQTDLAAAAGNGQYLVAWIETENDNRSVRASRVDRRGNYLDGVGIVLAEWKSPVLAAGPESGGILSVDGNGVSWLVVWPHDGQVSGRWISANGILGPMMSIGPGSEAAVRWTGTAFMVLHIHEHQVLYSTLVTPDGAILPSRIVAEAAGGTFTASALAVVAGQAVVFYAGRSDKACVACLQTLSALRVDASGTPIDISPLQIATYRLSAEPRIFAAGGGDRALVGWSVDTSTRYTPPDAVDAYAVPVFVDGGMRAGAPVRLGDGYGPAIAFDGHGFIAVWHAKRPFLRKIVRVVRIDATETLSAATQVPMLETESGDRPVVAANADLPPLLAWPARLPQYDEVLRGNLLFASELAGADDPPAAPVAICASQPGEDVWSVQWRPPANSLGTSIELQLDDGAYRQIGVAAAEATSARVTAGGLTGSAIRLRAWNGGGESLPSAIARALPEPSATMRSSVRTCAGVPVTITATLRGLPPFTVRWSDGVVQSGVTAHTVSRTLTLGKDKILTITSVTDASCAPGTTRETVHITVDAAPSITHQSHEVHITAGQSARLTVVASSNEATYEWFLGAPGDTSQPAGSHAPSFTTPALVRTTHYWVRVTGHCGSVNSDPIVVYVPGKRRAARH